MEYDYADQLDLEWQSLLQKHLEAFSCQKGAPKPYTYDEVLEKVFCPDNEFEQDTNYKDREICEKCLTEALQFLATRPTPPRQTQIRSLLNIAKYTARDETCFINMYANTLFLNLMYFPPSNITADKKTKILFLELLSSVLDHQSGIRKLMETKYWTQGYTLILDDQDVDEDISNMGYKFLTKLLEKTVSIEKDFCLEIIKVIAGPLLNAANLLEKKPKCAKMDIIEGLKPHILCLVATLERLLEKYSAGVLNCVMELKIDVASDTVSKVTNDKSICLILDRIAIILSFFKLTDIFDGIKSISQDPLAVTGFLRIIDTEVDKGSFGLIFELYYYALKYLKPISEKLPKCVLNGKNVDIETEIVCFQLEPILVISQKLNYNKVIKELDTDLIRMSHFTQVLQHLSYNTLQVGIKIKHSMPAFPIEIYLNALKYITKSTHLYSKQHLGLSFEAIIFSLQDTVDHIKLIKETEQTIEIDLQLYVLELLKAILIFIESYNLNWSDSVKILELVQIVSGGCAAHQWPAQIVVQGLKLLQEIISRRLSPAMSLLIDCHEELRELGPLLYQKCFTTEPEIRQSVLEVVHTLAISANKSFPSFKNLLTDAALPHLISTMALNDESATVRATAFKCLQEMILMEDMEEILPKNHFIDKVLDVLLTNTPPLVIKEAIKLIKIAYLHRSGLEEKIMAKAYKHLEQVTLTNSEVCVQIEALKFWRDVTRRFLSQQGWMDRKFPTVTFSKRIVCMTNKEIRKRIYKVLNELSINGCLNVFEKLLHFENLSPEANAFCKTMIFRFYTIFQEHEVTPESMLFNEEFTDVESIGNIILSPPDSVHSTESEELIQEIINDTVMKMIPDDVEFVQDEDLYSLIDSKRCRRIYHQSTEQHFPPTNRQITPSEFVNFVYKRVAYITSTEVSVDKYLHLSEKNRESEVYNIIDF